MVEGRRFPLCRAMTFAAIGRDALMELVVWSVHFVAVDALFRTSNREILVIECCGLPFSSAVARSTICLRLAVQIIVRSFVATDALR